MTKTAEVLPKEKEEFCPVCANRLEDCVCCPECGHECLLNQGEMYCPVCGPLPPKTEPLNNK